MIKLIEQADKLNALNPFSIRVKALYNAYTKTDICDFYIDTKSNCAMAKCGDVIILDGENLVDKYEIIGFCRIVGVKTILCSGKLKLSLPNKTEGFVLKYGGGAVATLKKDVVINNNLRDIYSLVSHNMGDALDGVEFEDYYVDLSHKIRHKCASSAVIYENNVPVSCAVAPFMCSEGAVISAVCTDVKFRNKGYGKNAVLSLINYLVSGKITEIYLQIEDESLLDFYKPLGFTKFGIWQEVKI